MLNGIRYLPKLGRQFAICCDLRSSLAASSKIRNGSENCDLCSVKSIHTSGPRAYSYIKDRKKKFIKGSKGNKEELSAENVYSDASEKFFPDENTPNQLFDGVPFSQIPIVNVKVSANNTILNLTDAKGVTKMIRSCGMDGFKNTKKGTNIAAQATSLNFGRNAVDMGYRTVRVKIQGLGPGRISSIRGLCVTKSTKTKEIKANIIGFTDLFDIVFFNRRGRVL
ncbi:UNVERIFIED_CONTAM: hypothetical protein PYX00_000224 [Menopon gallinae]|uniref:Ribosomal protein S11 n=1 Tax=Menopon gallinae TaxID=328185 RepID=A0AAW2I9K3_9NEOP